MKRLTLPALLVFLLVAGLALASPIFAQDSEDDPDEKERTDNKILVTDVPQGWSIVVAPLGAPFPTGPGNVPDNQGVVTAYAPLNKLSYVYLWDGSRNNLIATVSPGATFPDTVLNGQVLYAQAMSNVGLASPIQGNPGAGSQTSNNANQGAGQGNFGLGNQTGDMSQGTLGQSNNASQGATQFSRQYTVQPGDTLSVIARDHGVSLADLVQANSISDPNLIRSGQVIMVP